MRAWTKGAIIGAIWGVISLIIAFVIFPLLELFGEHTAYYLRIILSFTVGLPMLIMYFIGNLFTIGNLFCMGYCEITEKSVEILSKLDRSDKEKILLRIEKLTSNPYYFGKRLKGSDLWSLRAGDFRVILQPDEKDNKIFVVAIGRRKNIYDAI